jgi:DNA-binding GntR family transcriptional regulator
MLDLPQFKAVAMRDAVVAALRHALLGGRFAPGEALVESVLAKEMKVSRGPVREALLLLMQEGLVTHNQNRGFAVLNFTAADRFATDQVRYQLETLTLRLVRERISRADLGDLQRIKDRMMDGYSDRGGRVAAEIEFHGSIWRLTGNPYLVNCLERVSIPNFTYGTAYLMNRPDLTRELFDEQHQLYIDYLHGHTDKTAEEVVQFHLGLTAPAPGCAPEEKAPAL